jgi:endoglucanase
MPEVARLLAALTNAPGPSGFEAPVRAVLREALRPHAAELSADGLGSLIARLAGPAEGPRVMLTAHMDELGLLVRRITPEGYLKFQTLGGWLDQALINQRWTVLTRSGPVPGVSGIKTVHVMTPEARGRVFGRDDLFIDVGAASAQDASERLQIRPGDPVVPDSPFQELAGGRLYLAKAWDDRVGCGLLACVARELATAPAPGVVFAVGTVQEEVGLRGAETAARHVAPDIGINLESGVAGDYPGITPDEAQERLGAGPAIFLHDSSMLPNLALRDLCSDVASEAGIPLQFNVLTGYGQDGAALQRSGSGTPTINIAVPTRYLHSHHGVISRDDFDAAVRLVAALVRRLDAPTVARLRRFE